MWCEDATMRAVIEGPNLYGEMSRKNLKVGVEGISSLCFRENSNHLDKWLRMNERRKRKVTRMT